AEYALRYFNSARPHQGIGQRIPVPGERVRAGSGSVTALPVVGGVHPDYRAALAATRAEFEKLAASAAPPFREHLESMAARYRELERRAKGWPRVGSADPRT